MASASRASAADQECNYEVFLSFRGADTRQGITSDIYRELQNVKGVETFMDGQKIEVGNDLSPILLKAIKESRFAVVVLSQKYADSTWCLEELVTIFKCMTDKNRILPLFYKVDPSDVRYQKGTFGVAFAKHESRHGIEKVKQWKNALTNVASLSGWDSINYRSDEGLVLDKKIVDDVVKLVFSRVLQVRIETPREFEEFEATKLALDKVTEVLQDDEVTVIGLCGIKGAGKTTLVKHVGAQARTNGHFNKVIMAVLSQIFGLYKIQDQLADMLALKFEKDTEEKGRAVVLQEAILRENKLLIILDDVWKIVPLSSIGIPNNEELQKRNSKVLFTARIQKLCQEMQSDVKINLGVLSEEDSLKLLLKKVKMAFHESTEVFYSVARDVARNCAGVPVALTTIATELRDKGLSEWMKAAERLRGSQSADPEDENHVFNCIKLCNESSDAKSYLLLFCLFPEDYDISIEDVFRYGFGKGMFQGSDTLQEARARADLVVKSLKDLGLLLESEKKRCIKIHHVIRDVALSISSSEDGPQMLVKCGNRKGIPSGANRRSENFASNYTKWPDADINYYAISLINMRIENPTSQLVCPKSLQILSLKDSSCNRNFSSDHGVFQSHDELRVLDLRESNIRYFNKVTGNKMTSQLPNLRALFIDCDEVFGLEFDFGKLGKLEILDIRQLGGFPEDLGYLRNLRMLDVSNPLHDRFPPQVISRLINLEELYMKGLFIWGRKDHEEEAGSQTDLCCEEFIGLPRLNTLEVQIHDVGCLPEVVEFNPHWVKFDITFSAEADDDFLNGHLTELPLHDSQNYLCLETTIVNLPDWFHKVVSEKTERLVYYLFRDMNNILVEYGNGRLNGVKYLSVIKCKSRRSFKWRELMNAVELDVPDKQPVFENLEELYVEDVPCMELCVGELPLGSFCNLKKFKVLACSNMKNALLSSNLLKRLQNLEELICRGLRRIKYMFGTDGMEPDQIIFTKLRKIHLRNLPKLVDMCNGPCSPNAIFQNLKYLAIGNCSTLEYVFSSHSAVECFVQLEELYVYECLNLEAVIGACEEADNLDMIVFPKLKILFLVDLEKLTRFYGTIGSHQPIINCPELERRCFSESRKFNTRQNLSKIRSSKQVRVCNQREYRSTLERLQLDEE